MNITAQEAEALTDEIVYYVMGNLPDGGRLTLANLLHENKSTIRSAILSRNGHVWNDRKGRWVETMDER